MVHGTRRLKRFRLVLRAEATWANDEITVPSYMTFGGRRYSTEAIVYAEDGFTAWCRVREGSREGVLMEPWAYKAVILGRLYTGHLGAIAAPLRRPGR